MAVHRTENRNGNSIGHRNAPARGRRGAARAALLGTVAAGALVMAQPALAQVSAQCTVDGTTATCTGDQSAGVYVRSGSTVDTLIIEDLTSDITPASGTDGVNFEKGASDTGNITITVDAGDFDINTIGSGDEGINAQHSGSGDITIGSTANIDSATAGGIRARVDGNGDITITNGDGDPDTLATTGIVSDDQGIYARVVGTGGGDVTIWSEGSIDSRNRDGSDGNQARAIDVRVGQFGSGSTGSIRVESFGDILSDGDAILLSHYGGTDVDADGIYVRSVGDITSYTSAAIVTSVSGNGGIVIHSEGNLFADTTSNNTYGIGATTGNGDIEITSDGDISANEQGIIASTGTGDISITSDGDITTSNDAHAIYATSSNGTVNVYSTGNVTGSGTSGNYSGIRVTAGSGSEVSVGGGVVRNESTRSGAGVDFRGSAGTSTNILTVRSDGVVTSPSGTAVRGSDGAETVRNYGRLIGSVVLSDGGSDDADVLRNEAGGVFESGEQIFLGSTADSDTFTNAGTWSPGGLLFETTTVTGDVEQTGDGTLLIDVGSSGGSSGGGSQDLVSITGSADLAGTVQLQFTNLPAGGQTFTVLEAAGGVTDNGLNTASPAAQLIVNATSVEVGVSFAGAGANQPDLDANQAGLGAYFDDAMAAAAAAGTDSGIDPLLVALLNGPSTAAAYEAALDQLLPEVYLDTGTATLLASESFSEALFSCPTAGEGMAVLREGQCIWVRAGGDFLSFDDDFDTTVTTAGVSAGAQFALAPGWFANVGVGYELGWLETDTDAESDSNRYQVGASLKYETGPWTFAGALSGGVAQYDTSRPVDLVLDQTATSDHDVVFASGRLRAAYDLLPGAWWYARPMFDVAATYVDREEITESGGGSANLTIPGESDTFVSLGPSVEVGTEVGDLASGLVLRPYVRAGLTYFLDDTQSLTASFLDESVGLGGFTTETDFGQVFGDVEAGVTMFHEDGMSLSVGYDGRFSGDTRQHGVAATFRMEF